MHAAILREYGGVPEVGDWDEPEAADGQVVVDVLAGGLNPVDLRIGSGTYFGGAPPLPYVVGREGVGRLGDEVVYFDGPVHPHGSFAARSLVDPKTHAYLPAHVLRERFAAAGALEAERVITYCGGGIAASSDAFVLTLLGHDGVAVYDASLSEWAADPSLPMETG